MRYIKYLIIIIVSLVVFFAAKSSTSNYFSALNKLTKKDWLMLLEFWPLSIVTPVMLILILFGPIIMR